MLAFLLEASIWGDARTLSSISPSLYMVVILKASNWSLIHLLNPLIMLVLTYVSSKGHVPPDRLLWLHKKTKKKHSFPPFQASTDMISS